MRKSEEALALHHAGSNCAQSVLCAFAAELNFDPGQAHRLTTGLGGGIGRRQHLCGAINGGAMALSAAYGNQSGADQAAKQRSYREAAAFVRAMEAEFGSLECSVLLGVDLNTADGQTEFKERGLLQSVCERLIARCADAVQEQLAAGGNDSGTE